MTRITIDIGDVVDEETDEILAMIRASAEPGDTVVLGKIEACEVCGYYECVCEIRKTHDPKCPFRVAMECMIDIGCPTHGTHICPCTSCSCGGKASGKSDE